MRARRAWIVAFLAQTPATPQIPSSGSGSNRSSSGPAGSNFPVQSEFHELSRGVSTPREMPFQPLFRAEYPRQNPPPAPLAPSLRQSRRQCTRFSPSEIAQQAPHSSCGNQARQPEPLHATKEVRDPPNPVPAYIHLRASAEKKAPDLLENRRHSGRAKQAQAL